MTPDQEQPKPKPGKCERCGLYPATDKSENWVNVCGPCKTRETGKEVTYEEKEEKI